MNGDGVIALYANNMKLGDAIVPAESSATPDGRAVLIAHVPVTVTCFVAFDADAVATINERAEFGNAHLRALLEALPRCEGGDGSVCHHAATYTGRFCDEHREEMRVSDDMEFGYAPVVRFIEKRISERFVEEIPR